LRDQAGKIIGAIECLPLQGGDDKLALQKIAQEIRDEMKTQLPDANDYSVLPRRAHTTKIC